MPRLRCCKSKYLSSYRHAQPCLILVGCSRLPCLVCSFSIYQPNVDHFEIMQVHDWRLGAPWAHLLCGASNYSVLPLSVLWTWHPASWGAVCCSCDVHCALVHSIFFNLLHGPTLKPPKHIKKKNKNKNFLPIVFFLSIWSPDRHRIPSILQLSESIEPCPLLAFLRTKLHNEERVKKRQRERECWRR